MMGTFCASVTHLEEIIQTVGKFYHGMTKPDLDCKDKMNYTSILKMTDERVLKLLRDRKLRPDSEATEMFLTITRDILDSYLDPLLLPSERVFMIVRALSFLRMWRAWLLEEGHGLEHSFITPNTFQCIELNALALIKFLKICRDRKKPHLFIPEYLGSQTCEKIFRAIRSQTSTSVTVTNVSMKGILSRVRRIELQNRIVSTLQDDFAFPRYAQLFF